MIFVPMHSAPMDLVIDTIEVKSSFAGKLGRRIEETLVCHSSDGTKITIRLPKYHTRFGAVKPVFHEGDHIQASHSGWNERGSIRITR